jgi:hypothetical protein
MFSGFRIKNRNSLTAALALSGKNLIRTGIMDIHEMLAEMIKNVVIIGVKGLFL